MNILVIGANGGVGSLLVQQLAKEKCTIYCRC
ncbi:oxidoreductase ylbE [Staphylococcus aureus]|uniref:Oxidoreductase ylbE n=1 Tax=Staphylococcus aureus TaxID=1280 RepID=A0A380DSL3_STAAU|nr:oxidoreductase ylbE [Staphylococcus aureus]